MVQQQGNAQQRFSTLLENGYDYDRPRGGQVCSATILSIDENEVIVDLGCKRDGIVPRTDLELLDDAYRDSLQVGEEVPVSVLTVSGRQGDLAVSLNKGLAQRDWLRAEDLLESGEVCQAEVIHENRGGIVVQFGRLRGFVPNSHLTAMNHGARGERLCRAKSMLLGQTLSLVVIEVDQQHRRLMLSQRLADRHRRQKLLAELTVCATCFTKVGPPPKQGGVVKWFNPGKHYGFISVEEGEDVFFHRQQVVEGGEETHQGQIARFHVHYTERGPEALNMELLEK